MPNWCYNSVTLTTESVEDADNFEAFLNSLSESKEFTEPGILGYFLPRPKDEDDNWYGWNVENWGTKWDVSECDWERVDNTFYLNFNTAWGPPTASYEHIQDEGMWDVEAFYEEPGMCFVGRFQDGIDESYEYDFDDENWSDGIPEDLIEFAGLDVSYEDYVDMMEDEDDEL